MKPRYRPKNRPIAVSVLFAGRLGSANMICKITAFAKRKIQTSRYAVRAWPLRRAGLFVTGIAVVVDIVSLPEA
nr:hypothetical protein Ade03nite_84430 [Actinoplanes derwentensis]